VVSDVTGNMTRLDRLRIMVNGEDRELIAFCRISINIITAEAQALLARISPKKSVEFRLFLQWLKNKANPLLKALYEEDMKGYIERAESAKSLLQIAISVAALTKIDSA